MFRGMLTSTGLRACAATGGCEPVVEPDTRSNRAGRTENLDAECCTFECRSRHRGPLTAVWLTSYSRRTDFQGGVPCGQALSALRVSSHSSP